MVAIPNGAFGGVAPPAFQTGKLYHPHHLISTGATITLTANRLYRAWFYVAAPTTFLGGWAYNSGAGDNAKVFRIGVWDANGVLQKDFGEVTLSGAAALRQDASTITLNPGWYQVGMVTSTTPVFYAMQAMGYESAVGQAINPLSGLLGGFTVQIAPSASPSLSAPVGDYAAFTYGALPSTLTVATATIYGNDSASAGTFPLMGLYL